MQLMLEYLWKYVYGVCRTYSTMCVVFIKDTFADLVPPLHYIFTPWFSSSFPFSTVLSMNTQSSLVGAYSIIRPLLTILLLPPVSPPPFLFVAGCVFGGAAVKELFSASCIPPSPKQTGRYQLQQPLHDDGEKMTYMYTGPLASPPWECFYTKSYKGVPSLPHLLEKTSTVIIYGCIETLFCKTFAITL